VNIPKNQKNAAEAEIPNDEDQEAVTNGEDRPPEAEANRLLLVLAVFMNIKDCCRCTW